MGAKTDALSSGVMHSAKQHPQNPERMAEMVATVPATSPNPNTGIRVESLYTKISGTQQMTFATNTAMDAHCIASRQPWTEPATDLAISVPKMTNNFKGTGGHECMCSKRVQPMRKSAPRNCSQLPDTDKATCQNAFGVAVRVVAGSPIIDGPVEHKEPNGAPETAYYN